MSSGGQQPVTQQTQQTRDPWAPAQPYLVEGMSNARDYFEQGKGYQPWTGPTQADLHPYFNLGAQDYTNALWQDAATGGSAGVNAARALGTQTIQDQGFSPELRSLYQQAQGDQNPYLEGTIRQGVNQANAAASGAGRYGSGGHDAAITQAMAPIMAQDYARRQQQMQSIAGGAQQAAGQWAQMMPTLDAARLAPAQNLMTLGQFYNERAQSGLGDQIKTYNAQQSLPWEQLARYNAIVGGAGGLGGTMSGTQTTPINNPSTLQKLFGGAAAGAGIGGSFGGPAGAGIGALGGGLLGLL